MFYKRLYLLPFQNGNTVHTALTSDPGVRTGVWDETICGAVHTIPAAAHILRLPASIRPVLDRRRLRAQHEQPLLMINGTVVVLSLLLLIIILIIIIIIYLTVYATMGTARWNEFGPGKRFYFNVSLELKKKKKYAYSNFNNIIVLNCEYRLYSNFVRVTSIFIRPK